MRRATSQRIAERAERRRALFSVFFRHHEGTRREKMRAYAVLDAVRDPDERALLRDLLRSLQSIHDSCPPTNEPTP